MTFPARITNPRILSWLHKGLTPAELAELQQDSTSPIAGIFVGNTRGRVSGVLDVKADGSYELLAGTIAQDSLLFYLDPVHSKHPVQIGMPDWDYYVTHGIEHLGKPTTKAGTLELLAAGQAHRRQNTQEKLARSRKAATRYPDDTKLAVLELLFKGVRVGTVQAKYEVDRATIYRWRKAVTAGVCEEVRLQNT